MPFYYNGTNGNNYFNYNGRQALYADGKAGRDHILGNTRNDTLFGGTGDDTLVGYVGNDSLYGEKGDDVLSGGNGSDWLDGFGSGVEYDTLYGGAGRDYFVLGGPWGVSYLADGYATIKDWTTADRIVVKGSASQYSLRFGDIIGSGAADTVVMYGSKLIGIVEDTTNVRLSRDFIFT